MFYPLGKKTPKNFTGVEFCFPSLAFFFVGKTEPKIFEFKNVMERGIRKCFNFVIPQISSKILGKIIPQALFSKRLKFP